ncbi:hypothetical protein O6H91_01G084500 [Diphasiastrum complanatum]|uniref:Uncharacterized protein n=1 Tax=Diphasiastrum complanatum TaxID=34168 RepID=A0ACC2ET08_DIPCM|nr:hypothetical protein O6H91_01G084500 [Diphasiastrum complanatum]
MTSAVPTVSTFGQRLERDESSLSLLSSRGSEFGSRYIQADDSGVYLSSLAVTILVSSTATIAILLITLTITLAVMLGACRVQPEMLLSQNRMNAPNNCLAFIRNVEVNNVNGWVLPKDCEKSVSEYICTGQYYSDVAETLNAAGRYLQSTVLKADASDAIVLDVDETALSNIPYFAQRLYDDARLDGKSWTDWVRAAEAPPLLPTLSLYRELVAANWSVIFITNRQEAQRSSTIQNLLSAGYDNWAELILRSQDEQQLAASEYKSKRRVDLSREGYHIWTILGDQWSDMMGAASGNQTFKLPNPMYHI